MVATNAATPPSARQGAVSARVAAVNAASMPQAATSSRAAQRNAKRPIDECWRLNDDRMRANTGNAVTDSAVPRNSAKIGHDVAAPAISG